MGCTHECSEHPMRVRKGRKAGVAYKLAGRFWCPWCGSGVRIGYSWVCTGCGRSGTKLDEGDD